MPPLREEMTLSMELRVRSIEENWPSYWFNSAAETGVVSGSRSLTGGTTKESDSGGGAADENIGLTGRPKLEEEEEMPLVGGGPRGENENPVLRTDEADSNLEI